MNSATGATDTQGPVRQFGPSRVVGLFGPTKITVHAGATGVNIAPRAITTLEQNGHTRLLVFRDLLDQLVTCQTCKTI